MISLNRSCKSALIAALTSLLVACGGGGGGTSPTPQAQASAVVTVADQVQIAPVIKAKTWVTLDSASIQYDGTVLADNVIKRNDGSNLFVFSGPSYNTPCPKLGFKALTVATTGKISDTSNLLQQTSTATHARQLIVGDFNGDGQPDLFFANHGCDVDPYPGEKNSLFESNGNNFDDKSYTLPNLLGFTHSAAAGDLRKNGKSDIIVGILNHTLNPALPYQYRGANTQAELLGSYILRNNADGTFTYDNTSLPDEFDNPSQNGEVLWVTSTQVADLNGDGYPDLILGASQVTTNAGAIYMNDGKGGFKTDKIILPPGLFGAKNTITVSITVADVDGDGKPDLILSQTQAAPNYYMAGKIQVLLNKGNGVFVDGTDQIIPNQQTNKSWSQWVHVVDVNCDGIKDIILENDLVKGGDVVMYIGSADHTFKPADSSKLPPTLNSLRPLNFDNRTVLASTQKISASNIQVQVFEYK
jgi:hypothetical protein